jgi:enoyl-CoA hydratase/carnithine racemase
VNFGMVAALEPIGLFRRLPMQEISRFVLLGKDIRMTAERAVQLGFASEVMPREELWPRAHELAALIATRSPGAIQGTIRALWDAIDMPRYSAYSAGVMYPLYGNRRAQEDMRRSGELDASRKV